MCGWSISVWWLNCHSWHVILIMSNWDLKPSFCFCYCFVCLLLFVIVVVVSRYCCYCCHSWCCCCCWWWWWWSSVEYPAPHLQFFDMAVGDSKAVSFLLKNHSNSSTVRFQMSCSLQDVAFSPSKGHILPGQSKEITAVCCCSKPRTVKAERILCQLSRIVYNQPLNEVSLLKRGNAGLVRACASTNGFNWHIAVCVSASSVLLML